MRHWNRLSVIILFIIFSIFVNKSVLAFSGTARVSRTRAAIAESLSIQIEMSGLPLNATLVGPWSGSGWQTPFVLLQSNSIETTGPTAKWTGVFAVMDTGNVAVPSFDIFAIRGTDTSRFKTNSIPITIHSTLNAKPGPGLDTLLKPDLPMKTIPPSWLEWLLWIGAPIALAALIYGYLRYQKYRKSLLPPPPPPPPPSPEHVAFERLAIIKNEAKWELGDIKGFQTDLIDIIKEYLEGRFNYNALEKTTSELRSKEVAAILGNEEHKIFIGLLSIADEVKFARGEIANNRCLEGVKEAEQLVGVWGIRWQKQQDDLRAKAIAEATAQQKESKSSSSQPSAAEISSSKSNQMASITQDSKNSNRTLLDELREAEKGREGDRQ